MVKKVKAFFVLFIFKVWKSYICKCKLIFYLFFLFKSYKSLVSYNYVSCYMSNIEC